MKPTDAEMDFLRSAAKFFADPGVIAKSLTWVGKPVEKLQEKLPKNFQTRLQKASEAAIKRAMIAAVRTLKDDERRTPEIIDSSVFSNSSQGSPSSATTSSRLHRGVSVLTGAAGGLFGWPAMIVELPVTTIVILRGITDQAKRFGFNIEDPAIQLECLTVFSMGTASPDDDAMNSSYFATRASFASLINQLSQSAARVTLKDFVMSVQGGGLPIAGKLISKVAEKFQIRVSQKFLAEGVPIVGAIGGGLLNYAFTDFFVRTAHFHFGVRNLETRYGAETIRAILESEGLGAR